MFEALDQLALRHGGTVRGGLLLRQLALARRLTITVDGHALAITMAHVVHRGPLTRRALVHFDVAAPLPWGLRSLQLSRRTRLAKRLLGAPVLDPQFDAVVQVSGYLPRRDDVLAAARAPLLRFFAVPPRALAMTDGSFGVRFGPRRVVGRAAVPEDEPAVLDGLVELIVALASPPRADLPRAIVTDVERP